MTADTEEIQLVSIKQASKTLGFLKTHCGSGCVTAGFPISRLGRRSMISTQDIVKFIEKGRIAPDDWEVPSE